MRSETNPTTSEFATLVDVLLLDRDGRRCSERLCALAKAPRVGTVASAESLASWQCRPGQVSLDVLVISADTFSEAELAAAIEWLEISHPEARFVLTDVPDLRGRGLRPLELGAWACLPEGTPFSELLDRIADTASGRVRLTGDQLGLVMRRLRELARLRPAYLGAAEVLGESRLTPRQREVLRLMAARMSNREIAARLSLETGTVKNHVHGVLKKLRLHNRQQAAYVTSSRSVAGATIGPRGR